MKKTPVISWLSVVLLVIVIVASAYSANRQSRLTSDGAEAHIALCVFKQDLANRAQSSKEFLAMTPEERIDKYGQALGTIDPGFVRQSLANQQQTLESLSILDCQ